MKALRAFYALKTLREQPLWRLLSAERSVLILALLQSVFEEGSRVLPESTVLDRLNAELDTLRDNAEEVGNAQAYLTEWVTRGWLMRRLPAGAAEEVFELSADALAALRLTMGALKPRSLATETRLSLVIQQLSRLSQDTDADPASRLEALQQERRRIDDEIVKLGTQGVTVLPNDRALERAREIIALAEELSLDFRNVRDDFEKLNRELRQSLMEHEGSRAEVLEKLFAGVDVIAESDAGKSFGAFWRLLVDTEQSQVLQESLHAVLERSFSRELTRSERNFLQGLTRVLLAQGGGVHDVLQSLGKSLKTFVKSREYQEQRRLNVLLKDANVAAARAKEYVRANQELAFAMLLPTMNIRSVSQLRLYDPEEQIKDTSMQAGEVLTPDFEQIQAELRRSEIDFGALRLTIEDALQGQPEVGIEQLVARYGAPQGLGTVVGYLTLALKHGRPRPGAKATLQWNTMAGQPRAAQVAEHVFSRDTYGRK